MTRALLIAIFFSLHLFAGAQISSQSTYRFLSLTQSPREAALGGKAAIAKGDIGMSLANPALIDSSMDKNLLLQYTPYNAGINYGNVQYVFRTRAGKDFSLGVQSFSYGKLTQTDATGQITGEVSAADFAIHGGHSMLLFDRLKLGLNLKLIYSGLYNYQSFGIVGDIGTHYWNKDQSLQAGLIIRNIGTQITAYSGADRENLPMEVQFSISRKVAKAPFTIYFTADNLQKWDLAYQNAELNRAGTKEKWFTLDKLFRHVSGGVEFTPSDKFVLRTGYNYMRQQELKIPNRNSLSGFSFGLGFDLGRYHIEYALATYHLAGTSNHLSVHTDLGQMRKKRKG